MVILGVRIEFYEKVGDVGELSRNMRGVLYRDHGFQAAGVPSVGELFAITSLRVGPRERHVGPEFTGHGPFLPVRAVEHYPTPMSDDGDAPPWWDRSAEPSANIVLHTTLSSDPVLLHKFLARYAAPDSGWVGLFHDAELERLWWDLRPGAGPADE
ncbi:hypothetical protein ACIO3O_37725 [Streptomyces sp. NPDC087440]|uniref:hypothetical protein n=1 Tax=Streptomyces sp. NPDC087440 TaxID=3365790 RepID=UPI0037F33E17